MITTTGGIYNQFIHCSTCSFSSFQSCTSAFFAKYISLSPTTSDFLLHQQSVIILRRGDLSSNVGQVDTSYRFPPSLDGATVAQYSHSSHHSVATRDQERLGMAATMHDNLSQETVRVATATTTTSTLYPPEFITTLGDQQNQGLRSEAWLQSMLRAPLPPSMTEEPLRQSMESGAVMPNSYEEFSSSNASESSSVTLTEDGHAHSLPQFTFTWDSELPTLHPSPSQQTTWVFRQPNLQGDYNPARVRSRQGLLNNSSPLRHMPQVGPAESVWMSQMIEQVLVETVLDSMELAMYEIISIPGYLLDQGRSINCHGDLTGVWEIMGLMTFRDGYAYASCINYEHREVTSVRIPQIFFRGDET
ncbi:hypothetical protein DFH09DRAFT_1461993 [Mycena vulgaris]|nr:hypothetical protein DFH09DRAFT_1461993 [Mycena vulgaris]